MVIGLFFAYQEVLPQVIISGRTLGRVIIQNVYSIIHVDIMVSKKLFLSIC